MNPTNENLLINSGTVIGRVDEIIDTNISSSNLQAEQNVKNRQNNEMLPEHLKELYLSSSKDLKPNEKQQLHDLLVKHEGVFAKSSSDLGRTKVAKHKIYTGNSVPIKQRPRRPPLAFADEEAKIIQDQLDRNVIRESSSPWSSPLVYVRKKDGSTRLCVDYRRLNEVTNKDAYPLPKLSDCLDSLGGCAYFSTLDILSAYYQVEVDEKDREKTAFVCKHGLFEYLVMPFGLCNAPSTFQRLMELVMRGLQWKILLIYLDDLIIYANSFSEELDRLDTVFTRLKEAGLKLKAEKCFLFRTEVAFLGHLVSSTGIKPHPSKIETIKNWPTPKNLTELRSFLGFCSYYRRYIRGFSVRASAMNRLLEAGRPFIWSKECEHSFCDLKSSLTGKEVMAFPEDDGLFILDCDASDYGVGGALSQMQFSEHSQQMEERPIAFASKSLTRTQRKYCVTRRELLAVITFVEMFKQYLLGRQFLIRSDHSSLRWIMSFKNPENQMARWMEVLSQYDFRIEHRKGSKHVNCDALSRIPCDPCECECYDGKTVLEELPCHGCDSCVKKHKEWSILSDFDDVIPLVAKRVTVGNNSFKFSGIIVLLQLLFELLLKYMVRLGCLAFSLMVFMGSFFKIGFYKKCYLSLCRSYLTFRQTYKNKMVKIGRSTLIKDFGLETHAGGLYPKCEGVKTAKLRSSDKNSGTGNLPDLKVYKFSNWVGSYSNDELSKMQLEDPSIGAILKFVLQSEERPSRDIIAAESPATRNLWLQWSQLVVEDSVLFRKWISVDGLKSYKQLILPTVLRNEIIGLSHNTITCAHLGVKKTVQKLKLNFYWYKMEDSVRLWIRQCDKCGARKRPHKRPRAALTEYTVGFPMDRVVTDVLGPLTVSDNNNRYILVAMDTFTKYVEAYAIPDQTSETICNKLVFEFFSRLGLPLDLHSDQGRSYQSELFRQMCCLLEINQTKSSSYHPSANGICERYNQTLLNMITTYVNEEQTNWDVYLPLVTSAYRSSVHETTGYTPNYLMFGREVNLPVQFLVGVAPNHTLQSHPEYVSNLQDKFTKVYNSVRKSLKMNAIRQKRDYDTRLAQKNYNEADMVYCLDSTKVVGKSPKLKSQVWKGPYIIVRKISDILFEIKGSLKGKSKIIHHDRIKPYLSNVVPQWAMSLQAEIKDLKKQNKTTPVCVNSKIPEVVKLRQGIRERKQTQRFGIEA